MLHTSVSKKWPRLRADILASMPAEIGQRIASGQIIAAIQALHADDPPSRHTIQRALEELEAEGMVVRQGVSKGRVWWRTGKQAGPELARRPPLELAIALLTLKRHASSHLPAHVVEELDVYFAGAERVLGESPMDPSLGNARA